MPGTDPWLTRFLQHLQSERQVSPLTVDAYRRDLEAFVAFMGADPLRWPNLTPQHVRGFVAAEHRRGLSPRSLQRKLSSLRTLYRYLLREGAVEHNPADGVRAPKVGRKLPNVLDVDQTSALLDSPRGEGDDDTLALRDRAMFELLYGSGLRLAELVSLDVGSVDLQQGLARVTGKGSRERVVPVGEKARDAIEVWLRERATVARVGETALFVGQHGRRLGPRSVQTRLRDWAQQRGLPGVHPHTLRHCFASHLLESSGDLRAVQELLGHQNLSTTQVYTHLDFQRLAAVYDAAHPRSKRRKNNN